MNDVVGRLSLALADRYTIDRELGAGGMATVYLAHDLKHDRDVAIKVLHPDLGAALGGERFLTEIRTTARLQHPHVLPLLDSGDANGLLYYVMPLVTGETLRARLDREKQLPIPDAVRIAREVASALDYAHRQNVIHRDIKPENILLHDGSALVADFGIALAVQSAGGQRMTQTGLSLGTPQYMSPEQAMGERSIDARSDIYALGAVTYEMLAGDAPFTGSSVQAIVAKVISSDPERLSVVRKTVPPHIEAAVLTALAKLPADRFASAAEFATALQDRTYATDVTQNVNGVRSATTWKRVAFATAAIASAAVVAAAVWAFGQRSAPSAQRGVRVVMALPDNLELMGLNAGRMAISPDGSQFVFFARRARQQSSGADVPELWLRTANQLEATAIAGTKSASYPRFALDGRHIGFLDVLSNALKIIELDGGTVRTVADSGVRQTPIAFEPNGSIIASGGSVLVRFPADGGLRVPISTIDAKSGETEHVNPDVLPNGKGVIFTVQRTPSVNVSIYDIATLDLKSGKHRVLAIGVAARYVAGYLLIVHANGALTAAPFDQDAQQLTGAEVQIASDVSVASFGRVDLVTSGNGMLAYVAGSGASADANLIWVSRDGTVSSVDAQWRANFDAISISPDGRQLAVSLGDAAAEDVWIKQLDGGQTRLTFGGSRQYRPRWLPDGKSVLFLSEEIRPYSLVMKRADGIGAGQRMAPLAENIAEGFVSADGQWLIMRTSATAAGRGDIFARRVGDSVTIPLVVTKDVEERHPALSPDGKWLAYRSMESGRAEVYVRPFPNVNDGKWLVSLDGGGDPVWSHSGRELFYVSRSDQLWSATVAASPTFSVRERKKLFDLPAGVRALAATARFDVAPGDQRFLMIQSVGTADGNSGVKMVLLTNVLADLQSKTAAKK